jgi:lysyl-tRNA synthetase class 2
VTDENEIQRLRREKLATLRANGNAFPNTFRPTALAGDLLAQYGSLDKEALAARAIDVTVAGRIMLRRVMGKASFVTLQDASGRIQVYLRRDALGVDAYARFTDLVDIGDIVGVSGKLFRTNTGELTVEASRFEPLVKTIRPLPEKFHGLSDTEARYRQRYLDLIVNDETRRVFRTRSAVMQALREFFVERDFLEVETPMMHTLHSGGNARPFVTHHNSLDMQLYLRVAPELYLKRLVVGGFERVFELNRNFRNEGLSAKHNPEFTMLEFYQAYADYRDLMALTEELLAFVARKVNGTTEIEYQGQKLDLGKPIPRATVSQAITQFAGHTADTLANPVRVHELLRRAGVAPQNDWGHGRLLFELFEAEVEPKLVAPLFVIEHPTEISPLARRNDTNPDVTDRFELFITGREIANGFSELNDPDDQAERFRKQAERKAGGDLEAMQYDQDYVTALEHGLPPTAGEGIGVDRLVMLLTNTASIRDVLLFPHMRPKEP